MKQDDPFAKLGALDQKLYEETTPPNHEIMNSRKPEITNSGNHENPNSGNNEIMNSRKPENQISRKPEITKAPEPFIKAEKYSTQLRPSLKQQVAVYATLNNMKDYEVLEAALEQYFETRK
jgi:hypothetical protein